MQVNYTYKKGTVTFHKVPTESEIVKVISYYNYPKVILPKETTLDSGMSISEHIMKYGQLYSSDIEIYE